MSEHGTFCTVINCMDGRTQLQANGFLREHFGTDFVDTITEPGPVKILADADNTTLLETIKTRVDISVHQHGSIGIAIVAHYDCAGNPADKDTQIKQLTKAEIYLKNQYPTVPILKIWIGDDWKAVII